ncbi:hypothetical protein H6504_01635 [Candidatus Woesearchaeota archaeon]|nr:hypothetical protein [Candidatus Woesearchaeota archaeon]
MKRLLSILLLLAALVPVAHAELVLDSIQYDPAIIAAGDEVDIIVQFHDEETALQYSPEEQKDMTFKVLLEADDSLTGKYVTLVDAEGDDTQWRFISGGFFSKVFTVKVANNAPAGNYEFRLVGQWYDKGKPLDYQRYLRFKMPVKKEGIILDVATLTTVPAEVRPGDNYVKILTRVENTGQKDAKSIEIDLELPEGIEASYTNNNRVWIGRLNAGESKEVTFFVDVDEYLVDAVYQVTYKFSYLDLDDNQYSKQSSVPFLVKPRPYLEVVAYNGSGLAGASGKLYVTIENTGSESAEAVDVRLIKQNSQPFDLDVRSDYIGELAPGEQGVAIFNIDVRREAEFKEHDFKLQIRSKGDSDEGDDTIYMYTRRASFDVTGEASNKLRTYGLYGAGALLVVVILGKIFKRKKGRRS